MSLSDAKFQMKLYLLLYNVYTEKVNIDLLRSRKQTLPHIF